MQGGLGDDTFVFADTSEGGATAVTADVITDFTAGSDVIDLSGINVPGTGGSFLFGGQNSNVVANSVTWFENIDGDTIVQLDNTGDTTADMMITLKGTGLGLTTGDFLL